MSKLIYSMNVSLDGYVATSDGSPEWTSVDEELLSLWNEHARSIAASLYGRRLYELMSAYWPTAESDPSATQEMHEFARIWNRTPRFVFSSTLDHVEHNSRLVRGDVATALAEIRAEFDGDIEVGGPHLAGQFVRRGLVDEYRLVVHPVVLGGGKPFWPALDAPLTLRLVETQTFASGVELLVYSAH